MNKPGWCSVCGTTRDPERIHPIYDTFHIAFFAPHDYLTMCLACACSNPDAAAEDTCRECRRVVEELTR